MEKQNEEKPKESNELLLAPEMAKENNQDNNPWIIMVVDDDQAVHSLTEMILEGYTFEGRPLSLVSVYSEKEAMHLIRQNPDVALIFLDVVTEKENSGLDVVQYIRRILKNSDVRIILRTKYPENLHEFNAIKEYDINDYLRKTEITTQKFITTVTATLRSYHEITERKKSENILKESEEKFRAIFDNANVMIFGVDDKGTIKYFNKKAEQVLGYSQKEAIGMNTMLMHPPEQRENILKMFEVHVSGELTTNLELGYITKSGKRLIGSMAQAIFKDCKGKEWYFGIVEDITEQKKSEEALKESEEKFRAIFEEAADSIVLVNDAGEIVEFNNSAHENLGYTHDEFSKLNIIDINENQAELIKYVQKIHRKDSDDFIAKHKTKNGEVRDVHVTVRRISYRNSYYFAGIWRDITELKRMEAQLLQSQKMESIGTLAGGIAHNFNNLLTSIMDYSSLMLIDKDGSHPDYQKLIMIEKQVQKGAELTSQLLGFACGGRYEVKPADMNKLVESTANMFASAKKDITIYKQYQKDIWAVEVDHNQLEMALLNILINAWQALPVGGDIYLKTENIKFNQDQTEPRNVKPGKYVKVVIADTGVGMDEVTRQHVFEPFFTTKEISQNTGLGLATVYGIIMNHGGYIDVYSEKDKGATFSIYLPFTEKIVTTTEIPTQNQMYRGNGTVLLVDDEEFVLKATKAALEHLGYEVISAANGKEAIELYQQNMDSIDLVLLDMIMPSTSGDEVYDVIKAINQNVKVLLASGYSIKYKAEEILERGCNGFIQKPYTITALSQKLREILDQK